MNTVPGNKPLSKPSWPSADGREPFWCDAESDPIVVPIDPESDFNPLAEAIDTEIERLEATNSAIGLLMANALGELALKVRMSATFDPAEFPDRLAKLDAEIRHQKTAAGAGAWDGDEILEF